MLRGLDISDMLIIDRLELGFQPGLNVLTGETGAGKSILLDSLGFVLGWRGRADLVRQGAAQGEVTACFDLAPDHPAHSVLEEAGFPTSEELILRRVNTADGRKTAWVNDRRCSGEVLRALSGTSWTRKRARRRRWTPAAAPCNRQRRSAPMWSMPMT